MSALSISSISSTERSRRCERVPEFAALDVVGDILDALIAELAIAQSRNRIVFVKTLLRLRRRFDVPFDQRRIEGLATSAASTDLPVPGSPLISSGRSSRIAALTAIFRSFVAT